MARGLSGEITQLLQGTTALGGYTSAFVCTSDGLVVAAAGDPDIAEYTAAVVSLFDDVLHRAQRDLQFERVDEVALLDPGRGRLVIRPLEVSDASPFFLVVQVPKGARWRRNTTVLMKRLLPILEPLARGELG